MLLDPHTIASDVPKMIIKHAFAPRLGTSLFGRIASAHGVVLLPDA